MKELPCAFCSRCGCALDVRMAMQVHEDESKTDCIMDRHAVDPEFKEFVQSKLKTMAIAIATKPVL